MNGDRIEVHCKPDDPDDYAHFVWTHDGETWECKAHILYATEDYVPVPGYNVRDTAFIGELVRELVATPKWLQAAAIDAAR